MTDWLRFVHDQRANDYTDDEIMLALRGSGFTRSEASGLIKEAVRDEQRQWRDYFSTCEREGHGLEHVREYLILELHYPAPHIDHHIREYRRRVKSERMSVLAAMLFLVVCVPLLMLAQQNSLTGFAIFDATSGTVLNLNTTREIGVIGPNFYGVNTRGIWGANNSRIDLNTDGTLDTLSDYQWHRQKMLAAGIGAIRVDMNLEYETAPDGSFLPNQLGNLQSILMKKNEVEWAAQNGIKVTLLASAMPAFMADTTAGCTANINTCPPANNSAWADLVVRFIDVVTQNGTYASDVQVEVWNEPDGDWSFLSDRSKTDARRGYYYNRMYNATYHAIKAKYPQIPVGGLALAHYNVPTEGRMLFRQWLGNFSSPKQYDFVSTHEYQGLSDTMDLDVRMRTTLTELETNCQLYGNPCGPKQVNEWNVWDVNTKLTNPTEWSKQAALAYIGGLTTSPTTTTLDYYQWASPLKYANVSSWDLYPQRFDMVSEPRLDNVLYAPYAVTVAFSTYHHPGDTVLNATSADAAIRVLATRDSGDASIHVTVVNGKSATDTVNLTVTGSVLGSVTSLDTNASVPFSGASIAFGSLPAGAIRHYLLTFNTTVAPPPDTTPPTAPANLQITNVTNSSATLTWTAATDSSGVAQYRVWKNASIIANTTTTTTQLTTLAPGTTYLITVSAVDTAGNEGSPSAGVTFTTIANPIPDTTPPALLNLQIGAISQSSATVSWMTDESANASVLYGRTVAFGNHSDNGTLGANESILLSGLTPSTQYFYSATSCDTSGNCNTSTPSSFTTTNILDATPPTAMIISPVSGQAFAAGTTQTALAVTTDEPATCRYDTNDMNFLSMANVFTATGGTNHSATLSGLTDGNSFTIVVRCRDLSGNAMTTGVSVDFTVASNAPPLDTVPPSTPTNLQATSITNVSATLTWTAATDASGVAQYRIWQNASNTANSTATTAQLTNLASGTSYLVTVTAVDSAGNEGATSTDLLLTTLSNPVVDSVPPTVILVSPSDGSTVASLTPTFTWRATDNATAALRCTPTVDGRAISNVTTADGKPTSTSTRTSAGLHTWSVSCTDMAGNTGSSDTLSVKIISPTSGGGGGGSSGGGGSGKPTSSVTNGTGGNSTSSNATTNSTMPNGTATTSAAVSTSAGGGALSAHDANAVTLRAEEQTTERTKKVAPAGEADQQALISPGSEQPASGSSVLYGSVSSHAAWYATFTGGLLSIAILALHWRRRRTPDPAAPLTAPQN